MGDPAREIPTQDPARSASPSLHPWLGGQASMIEATCKPGMPDEKSCRAVSAQFWGTHKTPLSMPALQDTRHNTRQAGHEAAGRLHPGARARTVEVPCINPTSHPTSCRTAPVRAGVTVSELLTLTLDVAIPAPACDHSHRPSSSLAPWSLARWSGVFDFIQNHFLCSADSGP